MTRPSAAVVPEPHLAKIREELTRRLRKLERLTESFTNGRSREIDQSTVGRLSRIEALQNQGFTQDLEDRERSQRDEVLQALRRIDDGDFGLCSDCRGPIGLERLLIFPEARTCCGCPGAA